MNPHRPIRLPSRIPSRSAACTAAQAPPRAPSTAPDEPPPANARPAAANEPRGTVAEQHAQPHQAQGAGGGGARLGGQAAPIRITPCAPQGRGPQTRLPATRARPQAPVRRKLEREELPPAAPGGVEAQETSAPLPLSSGPLPDACACAMQRQDSAWSTLTDMGVQEEPAAPSTPEQSSASRSPPAALPAWAAVEAPLGYALQVRGSHPGAALACGCRGGAGAVHAAAALQPCSRRGAEGGSALVRGTPRPVPPLTAAPRRPPPCLPTPRRPGGRSWCGCSRL